MESPVLTQTERYATAALFALALHQSQIHQIRPSHTLSSLDNEPIGEGASIASEVSISDSPELWVHENSGLISPIFRSLGLDDHTLLGLKETACSSSQVRHHVSSFLKMLLEDEDKDGTSSERTDKGLGLAKVVDAMILNKESTPDSEDARSCDYETECLKKYANPKTDVVSREAVDTNDVSQGVSAEVPSGDTKHFGREVTEEYIGEGKSLIRHRKLTFCYELLSACIAGCAINGGKSSIANQYDARHRVALRLLATWLGVKWIEMEALEVMVSSSLMSSMEEDSNREQAEAMQNSWAGWKRGGAIGAAALTGGTLLAITGGIAAPAIAHGLAAVAPTMGSLVPAVGAGGFAGAATAVGSTTGSVAIAASFGAAGAGLSGAKMAKRTGNVEEFAFEEIGENHGKGWLAVDILVSGLAFNLDDFVRPWEGHDRKLERYALRWESEDLIALSTAVQDWISSRVAMELMKDGAMMTVLSALLAALSVPATLISAFDLLDSKWAIAIDRSDKAGKLLAEVLIKGLHGNRPVTLIGFSLGARVIFKCLQYLAEAGEENRGIVERVVLLGGPISIKDENWRTARKMVAGRFVNAFSTNDWTLGIAFRASLLSKGLAGIHTVDVPGIENVDVSEYIKGHASYLWMTKHILRRLELDGPYPVFRAPT